MPLQPKTWKCQLAKMKLQRKENLTQMLKLR